MPKPRKRIAARASRQASWLTTLVLVGRSLQAGPATNSVPDHRLDQPAPPFRIRYDRRTGTLEVRNLRVETSSYAASGAGPAPPQAPKLDEAQLASKMFDPANRALRVYAVASGGGSQATGYSPLFTIFNLTFDTANSALRVNCIAGCAGTVTFGMDISAIDSTHQKVVGLQGQPISSTAPASSNQFLGWNSTSSQWQPQQPSFANLSGTISIPSQLSIFGASGASHAPGAVPDPGATAGTSRFLREDATWNQVSFANLAGTASASQLPNPTGDVTGTYAATTVTGLHFGATGIPISSTAPTSGQCLQYNGTNIVGGTCGSGGAPGGTNAAVQFNNAGAFGGAANWTYNASTGAVGLSQLANGKDTLITARFTDTSPTGTLLRMQNAAKTSDLFTVDVTGTLTAGSIPDARLVTSYSGSGSCAANQFVTALNRAASPTCTQPSFSNLSGTISIPSQLSIFGASGASHAPGAVPDPGATAGTSRFLREDATWNQVSFANLAGTASASQLPNPAGDVTGTYAATTVTGLHFGATGIPISSTAPTSGQCLQYNGTNIVGGTCGSGGAPGGTNAAVQFNNAGAFGGDATNFSYNSTSHTLTVTGSVVANSFTATGNTTGCIQLSPANSANYSQICAATSLTNNTTWTWPAADGSNNQVLTTNGAGVLTWSTPSVTFGTDISAIDSTHQKVVGLQGQPISSTAPASSNQFLGWNSTSSQWQPQQPSFANLSGTISIPSQLSIFGASGASHAPGAVPDPGATAGTSRFLREDATWNQVSFANLSGTASASQLPNPTGDVTGTYAATTVTGLHFGATGIPISSTAPTSGQCLQYNGTNIVGGTCGGGLTVQTNGTNNASQTTLNFVNPASFNGLTFTFSNPSGGNETFSVGGTLNNAGLTNSSVTVNTNTCTLGGTCTVTLDQIGNPLGNASFTFPATNGLAVAGTAPASSATNGTNAGTLITFTGPAGGATTGSATTAGNGASLSFAAGPGGSGSGGTNAIGGNGGSFTFTAGDGGPSSGTAANSSGGGFTFTLGNKGSGGTGAAGSTGTFTINTNGAANADIVHVQSNGTNQFVVTSAGIAQVQNGLTFLTGGAAITTNAAAQSYSLNTSNSSSGTSNAGSITIQPGAASGTSTGNPGSVTIQGGNVTSTSASAKSAGNLTLAGGTSSATGNSTSAGGNVIIQAGSSSNGPQGQVQIEISKKATAALSANQLVKLDTANAGNVVVTATSDTTNFIGFTAGPISTGTAGPIIVAGEATGILGTGTCSVGQFVIVDTTTAGDVKCTSTFTAGTIIGFAETAQSTVGSTLTVLIDKR